MTSEWLAQLPESSGQGRRECLPGKPLPLHHGSSGSDTSTSTDFTQGNSSPRALSLESGAVATAPANASLPWCDMHDDEEDDLKVWQTSKVANKAPLNATVTVGDLGMDCCGGGTTKKVAEEATWSSPCKPQAVVNGMMMSTSPIAAERPRPPTVCLPAGALSYPACASPAASPSAGPRPPQTPSGDASTRAVPSQGSSTAVAAAGDASTRTPLAGTTMPMTATLMVSSPKACFGIDAPSAGSIMSTSPTGAMGQCWSPASSPTRVGWGPYLSSSDPSGSPTLMQSLHPQPASEPLGGQELAARLQAAAPLSYED